MSADTSTAPTPRAATLNIEQLARELGTSPTPVREALVQLENTSLVTRAALKGCRVAPLLTDDQLAELVTARTVVEIAAIEQAAARDAEFREGDLLDQLQGAHERHTRGARRVAERRLSGRRPSDHADVRDYVDAAWEFHLVILRAAGNRYLLQMAESLGTPVHLAGVARRSATGSR